MYGLYGFDHPCFLADWTTWSEWGGCSPGQASRRRTRECPAGNRCVGGAAEDTGSLCANTILTVPFESDRRWWRFEHYIDSAKYDLDLLHALKL